MFYHIKRDGKKLVLQGITTSKYNTHFGDYSKIKRTFANDDVLKNSPIQAYTLKISLWTYVF